MPWCIGIARTPPNRDRPRWTRPGVHGERPSGHSHRAGAATAPCPAVLLSQVTGTGTRPGSPFLGAVALGGLRGGRDRDPQLTEDCPGKWTRFRSCV